ncbi:MAG: SNF2-related protein, partial [Planctomycetaceae bacterium]
MIEDGPQSQESIAHAFGAVPKCHPVARPTGGIRPDTQRLEFMGAPPCRELMVQLRAQVYQSGLNGALRRAPRIETRCQELLKVESCLPAWRPRSQQLRVFRLVFPEGVEFETPPNRTNVAEQGLRSLAGPARAATDVSRSTKKTRIQPPSDVLSIEDRLFYLLQPPLENWLAGQELIMPFEPFPFQYEGIAWFFSQRAALLADEMGLGKTMQAITAVRLLLRSGQIRKVLLLCPKPLIPNWQREFRMWASELPVMTVQGDAARRRLLWTMPGNPVLIANYELLVRDFDAIPEDDRPEFDLVVLDEAQRIKNRDSRTAQTVRSLKRRRSWALTGTPIENRPEELASLFEFLEVIPNRGTPDIRQLTRLAKQFVLRRTKALVLHDLPPRTDLYTF